MASYIRDTEFIAGETYIFSFDFASYPQRVLLIYVVGTIGKKIFDGYLGDGETFEYTPEASYGELRLTVYAAGTMYIRHKRIDWSQFDHNMPKLLAFNMMTNSWVTTHDIEPDMLFHLDDVYYEIRDNDRDYSIKKHNYPPDRKAYIAFLVNELPDVVKILESVGVHASKAPSYLAVKTEDGYTSIYEGEFIDREDVFYAEVRNNMDTAGFDTPEEALNFGDKMKDDIFMVYLEWDDPTDLSFDFMTSRIISSSGHIKD